VIFPAALKSFDRAIQLDSRKVEYVVNRATVKYYMKDWDGAEAELQTASKLDAKEPNIYNTLALIETELNNLAKAEGLVERALRLSPDHPYYLNNRGYIYFYFKTSWIKRRQTLTGALDWTRTTDGRIATKEFSIL